MRTIQEIFDLALEVTFNGRYMCDALAALKTMDLITDEEHASADEAIHSLLGGCFSLHNLIARDQVTCWDKAFDRTAKVRYSIWRDWENRHQLIKEYLL